jgi:hypothetical protein
MYVRFYQPINEYCQAETHRPREYQSHTKHSLSFCVSLTGSTRDLQLTNTEPRSKRPPSTQGSVLSYAVLVYRATSSARQALRYIVRLRLRVEHQQRRCSTCALRNTPFHIPHICPSLFDSLGRIESALWP